MPPISTTTSSRSGPEYGHYVKVKLVNMMEDDLDVGIRATKKTLMAMNHQELDNYILKVSLAHEQWYQVQQSFDRGSSSDSD
jgi:hypothetical protein